MLGYDRIDIVKGTSINNANDSRECNDVLWSYNNGCHDLLQKYTGFDDSATVATVGETDYKIKFCDGTKVQALSRMKNVKKSKKLKYYFFFTLFIITNSKPKIKSPPPQKKKNTIKNIKEQRENLYSYNKKLIGTKRWQWDGLEEKVRKGIFYWKMPEEYKKRLKEYSYLIVDKICLKKTNKKWKNTWKNTGKNTLE